MTRTFIERNYTLKRKFNLTIMWNWRNIADVKNLSQFPVLRAVMIIGSASALLTSAISSGSQDLDFGTTKDTPSHARNLPTCYPMQCSGNGSIKVSYWPAVSAACQAYDNGQDFEQRYSHQFRWQCPNNVYYFTCAQQVPLAPTCNSFTPDPGCPAGTCTPQGPKPG